MSHNWAGMMNSASDASDVMYAPNNMGGFESTPGANTAPAPFVTTKRRNPFGGACARPKADKRMKMDGNAGETLDCQGHSRFHAGGANHAVAQRKRVVFAGIEFNTHVEPPAV